MSETCAVFGFHPIAFVIGHHQSSQGCRAQLTYHYFLLVLSCETTHLKTMLSPSSDVEGHRFTICVISNWVRAISLWRVLKSRYDQPSMHSGWDGMWGYYADKQRGGTVTHCMIPAAVGATYPNVWTWAITLCHLFFTSFSAMGVCFRCKVLVPTYIVQHIDGWVGVDINVNSFICDGKTQFLFCKSEVQPEPSSHYESILSIIVCFCPIGCHWEWHTAVENNDDISLLVYWLLHIVSVVCECERVKSYLDKGVW